MNLMGHTYAQFPDIIRNIYIEIYQTCLNFRPPHSRSGGHQGPETFLAPSADKQTGKGDIYGATGVLSESPKCLNCEQ